MRVLVTGANGHIGCNLVRELLPRGHQVVAMVREKSPREGLDGLKVELAFGDVRDGPAVMKAAEGCEAVIHLAAVYAWGGTAVEIQEPAVQGATNVLQAAKAHGIRRVVYTSSSAAVGVSHEAKALDESHWFDDARDAYPIAKTASERLATKLAQELDVPMVVLNPVAVAGRHDYRHTPSNDLVRQMAIGKAVTYEGGLTFVDVRDVAWVHAEALTKGEPGQRYLLTAENVTVRQYADLVLARTGKKATHLALPRWAAVAMVGVMESLRLLGTAKPGQQNLAAEFYRRWAWYDGTKARSAFGWTPRPLRETLDDTLLWLSHRGLLPPDVAAKVRETVGPAPAWS